MSLARLLFTTLIAGTLLAGCVTTPQEESVSLEEVRIMGHEHGDDEQPMDAARDAALALFAKPDDEKKEKKPKKDKDGTDPVCPDQVAALPTPYDWTFVPEAVGDGSPYGVHLSHAQDAQTTITVSWFTVGAESRNAKVVWGTKLCELDNEVVATQNPAFGVDVTTHTATITGLTPGQEILYYVDGDSGPSSTYEAKAAPEAGAPFRFFLYGDHGTARTSLNTSGLMAAAEPDLLIIAGDISYANGFQPIWDLYFAQNEPLYAEVPVMAAPGNHEAQDGEWMDGYQSRFAYPGRELWYGFDYSNVHFLMIEADGTSLLEHQDGSILADIEADLASAYQRRAAGEIDYIMVVQHFPLWSNHESRGNSYELIAIEEHLFQTYQIDFLLVGHNHHYERSKPMVMGQPTTDETTDYVDPVGYIQIISGGGGKSLYEFLPEDEFASWAVHHEKRFHYTEFAVDGSTITVTVHATDGDHEVLDEFTFRAAPTAGWI